MVCTSVLLIWHAFFSHIQNLSLYLLQRWPIFLCCSDGGIWKSEYLWLTGQIGWKNWPCMTRACLVLVLESWRGQYPGLKTNSEGFDLSCITCSQAGSWCFTNNKGDTMSVKQYITCRSIFKSESFVKGLPVECAIQKLVEIWWINGIDCSRSGKWGIPRLKTRKEEEGFWLENQEEYSKSRGWVDQVKIAIFFFFLSLFSFYCRAFVSIKTNGIYGLEVQLDGLKTKFQKEVLPSWSYDFSIHEIFESIREKE